MNTNIEVLRELDELVEAARLLGVTQAKKLFGCHTDEDRRFERAMYESIDKHRAALLNWGTKQPVPQQPTVVDEAMVERACRHWYAQWDKADRATRMVRAEKMYDLLAAALEAAREDGWHPIETAPNEAWFLVHSDRGWIGLARRSDPDYAPDEGWFEDEHTEFLDPAWLTHWRPLPAPPAIESAREERDALAHGGEE